MNKLNYIKHILLLSLMIISAGCSSSDKENKNNLKTSLPTMAKNPSSNNQGGKDYDECDCNKRSKKILDETLAFRLQFNSIDDLKRDQESKRTIRKFAKEFVKLTEKCFEINNARLLVDSECNNLRLLQAKKDSLRNLGIQIEQGESVRL